jgi:hypothetical protein
MGHCLAATHTQASLRSIARAHMRASVSRSRIDGRSRIRSSNMSRFAGKVAIITGSGGTIGRNHALYNFRAQQGRPLARPQSSSSETPPT